MTKKMLHRAGSEPGPKVRQFTVSTAVNALTGKQKNGAPQHECGAPVAPCCGNPPRFCAGNRSNEGEATARAER
jgi:hypothetical protein